MKQPLQTFAQYLTVGEAAQYLGVTAATLRNWDRTGKLKPRRHPQNGYRIYLHEDLEAILRSAERSIADGNALVHPHWGSIAEGEHFVQFYESEDFLVDCVGSYLAAALLDGHCAIGFVRSDRLPRIEKELEEHQIDCRQAAAEKRLLLVDASAAIERLLEGDLPDPAKFEQTVQGYISKLDTRGRRLYAFGEMVALLWADGKREAALRMENFWNDLGRRQKLSLCCAYPIGGFSDAEDGLFPALCDNHTVVYPSESFLSIADPEERLRAVAALQRKAVSLAAEVARRDQVMRELSRRERELADYYEKSSQGMHTLDDDGRILWANRAELQMLGYRPDEYIGHQVSEFHLDELAHKRLMRHVESGSEMFSLPARLRAKDGSTREVLISSTAAVEDGRFAFTRCFTRDVSEMRQAERDQAMLAAIIETSEDAIISKGFDGVIRSWNRSAERVFGYTEEEAINRPITIIIPPDRIEEEKEIIARLLRGERIEHFETVRLTKDGRLIDVSLSISPLLDASGNLVGASKIARDITERNCAEAELREREQRYQLVVAGAGAAIWDWDVVNRRTVYSPRWRELRGLGENDVSDSEDEWKKTIHPEDLPRVRRAIDNHLAGRTPNFAEEYRVQRSDGNWIWVLGRGICLRDQHGTVVRMAGSETDISELKRAEQLLLLADRRKDEFLATLAHELRNPLAPIRHGLEVLRNSGNGNSSQTLGGQVCSVMERQVEILTRLVDDLRDLSRITGGKIELRNQAVEFQQVIQSALETSRPLIDAAGHTLTVSLPQRAVMLDADPTRLAQVFSNLLNNSAKYTERGGRIDLSAEVDGSELTVTISDNGIGISREALAYVFDMFRQAEVARDHSQGGLGIGLTLVRRLVEIHGGTVSAHSDGVGKGSVFTVRLPIAEPTAAKESKEDEAKLDRPMKRKILVVDDNRDAVFTLTCLLRLNGNDVENAYDGQEALEAAEKFRPEVILMDVGMPRLDGYEATRRIREAPWGKDIFIIALSGWGQAEDVEKSVAAGCSAHITKPVDYAVLERMLCDQCGGNAESVSTPESEQ